MPRRLIAECTLAAAAAETHENIASSTLIVTGTLLEQDAPGSVPSARAEFVITPICPTRTRNPLPFRASATPDIR
jgi:2-keto-3-deoxy-6-phosphogluconate aldolase